MELDKIKKQTTWSDASSSINANFLKLKEAIALGSLGNAVLLDTEMSDESEGAVQNKVIKKYVDDMVASSSSTGKGLKYSEERTVYLTEIHILGEVDVAQISDEERAYNIETFNNAWNNQNVFISWFGTYFNPIEMRNGETYGSATFNALAEYNGILVSYIIKVDTNGDAVAELKEIQTGSTTPSDFNNDFNNDF